MNTARDTLSIVVVGHVDHGKSTVIGRLLYDTKSLPEGAIEKVKRISREKGKPFEYAYLLDAFEEEQKQGITIDTTRLQFKTAKRDYVIIDAPGHKEFLKNMISGAASAEAALLIIDAYEGIQEQSKRHGYILSLLGVRKVYVLVNKMDLIDYSAEKFHRIKHDMNEFLHNLHVYPLKYIPIAAFYGENLTSPSDKMPWYKGEPLLAAIDMFEKEQGLEGKPLRFPIQDVFKFDSRRIIAGRIETGSLHVGDEILISPGNRVTKVKTIEYWVGKDKRQRVDAGMSVGITVEDEFFNQRGEFISHIKDAPLIGDTFKANLFWMGKQELVKNREYKLKLVTQEVECEIVSIVKAVDATTLAHIENASIVRTNDVAEVIIRTKKQICFDEFKNNRNTGRFVLVDGYDVSGGGIISGLTEAIETTGRFVKDDLTMAVSCFDEYFFVLSAGVVKKRARRAPAFQVGDVLPATGQTYDYPENFDVLAIQGKLVAQIRKRRLYDIVALDEYRYEAAPLIDAGGASIQVASAADLAALKEDLKALDGSGAQEALAALANKWFVFTGFRRIGYLADDISAACEYHI